MLTSIGAGRSRVCGFADHPTDLSVTDRSRRVAGKGKVSREDEVPLHLFVDELILVMIEPDIVTCAFDVVGLVCLIKGGITRQFRIADIHMVIEDPHRMLRHRSGRPQEGNGEKDCDKSVIAPPAAEKK